MQQLQPFWPLSELQQLLLSPAGSQQLCFFLICSCLGFDDEQGLSWGDRLAVLNARLHHCSSNLSLRRCNSECNKHGCSIDKSECLAAVSSSYDNNGDGAAAQTLSVAVAV
jgi:hypothetical protein